MALLWEEMWSGESQLLGPVELMKSSKHLAARARMAVPFRVPLASGTAVRRPLYLLCFVT